MIKVVLSFDDGRKDNILVAGLLEEYGLSATFNITTGYVDGSSAPTACPCKNDPLSIDDVIRIYKNELFEIAGHGNDHLNVLNDWMVCINKMNKWLGLNKKEYGFASPHCGITAEEAKNVLNSGLVTYLRVGLKKQFNIPNRAFYKLALLTKNRFFYYLSAKNSFQTIGDSKIVYSIPVNRAISLDQVVYVVERAVKKNKDCVFMFHSILRNDQPFFSDAWTWSTDKFEGLCKYLRQRQNEGVLSVARLIDSFA